jgi:hypothetical protein
VISLDDDAFPEVQYTKANGEVRKVYVCSFKKRMIQKSCDKMAEI